MTTKATGNTLTTEIKPGAPRKTAKQRREEAELAQQAAWATFEERRHAEWLEMWTKALRLHLITEHLTDFKESYSWWFRDFRVNARDEYFQLDDTGSLEISEAKLHPSDVERINSALDQVLAWLKDFEEEKERKRLQALEEERERQAALARLTDREKQLLGLTRR